MSRIFIKKIFLLILQNLQPDLTYLILTFFRYLQIRYFVQANYPHFPNHPPGSVIDLLLSHNSTQKRSISMIYKTINVCLNPKPCTALFGFPPHMTSTLPVTKRNKTWQPFIEYFDRITIHPESD